VITLFADFGCFVNVMFQAESARLRFYSDCSLTYCQKDVQPEGKVPLKVFAFIMRSLRQSLIEELRPSQHSLLSLGG
jgi:hypothetical protein